MKKKLLLIVLLFTVTTVYAFKSSFSVDKTKIFDKDSRTKEVVKGLDAAYSIEYQSDNGLDRELEAFTKKITYLLLGDGDTSDEDIKTHALRKKEFKSLLYNLHIPEDEQDMFGGKYNEEYGVQSAYNQLCMEVFDAIDNFDLRYSNIGNITIYKNNKNEDVSRVVIENVSVLQKDPNNPRDFVRNETNLVIYYLLTKVEDETQLKYVLAEFDDDITKYMIQSEQNENNGISNMKLPFNSELSKQFDFSKLDALTDNDLKSIYNKNESKIMFLNTMYDASTVSQATGFMLTDKVIATSWDYLKESLIKGQFIMINDAKGNKYELKGIVSINEESSIALLLIDGYEGNGVTLSKTSSVKYEDPVFVLGTKTGFGLSTSSGIVFSTENVISSILPVSSSDRGAPLINSEGNVIGIINNGSINSSVSYATKIDCLIELQEKLQNSSNINYKSFEDLKEIYYNKKTNEEKIINNIPEKVWNEYKKIGNIEDKMFLELVKASYKDSVVSLRYKNEVNDILSNQVIIKTYTNELVKEGYSEKVNTKEKKVYESSKYRVTIMDEFGYIIVAMVKK